MRASLADSLRSPFQMQVLVQNLDHQRGTMPAETTQQILTWRSEHTEHLSHPSDRNLIRSHLWSMLECAFWAAAVISQHRLRLRRWQPRAVSIRCEVGYGAVGRRPQGRLLAA